MVISKVKRYFDHFEALRVTLVILLVLGCILFNLEVYGYFVGFGLYFGYFRSLWVFQSIPSFDGGISVILEALVVIIGYLVDFINIWDNDMHPSCTKHWLFGRFYQYMRQWHASIMHQTHIQSLTIILKEWGKILVLANFELN